VEHALDAGPLPNPFDHNSWLVLQTDLAMIAVPSGVQRLLPSGLTETKETTVLSDHRMLLTVWAPPGLQGKEPQHNLSWGPILCLCPKQVPQPLPGCVLLC
jgi:hypothetical protein